MLAAGRNTGIVALTVGLLVIAGTAEAQERRFELVWVAPSECPDAIAVERDVDTLLSTSESVGEVLRARAEVTGNAETRYVLQLTTQRGEQADSRALTGQSCEAVASAAALVIALQIDPEAVAEAQAAAEPDPATPNGDPPEEPPSEESPEVAAPEEPTPEEPTPEEPTGEDAAALSTSSPGASVEDPNPLSPALSPPRAMLTIAAGVDGDIGTLSDPALGASLLIGLRIDRLRLLLQVAYFPDRFANLEGRDGVGGDLSSLSAGLLAAYVLLPGQLEVSIGGGLGGGLLFGQGVGIAEPASAIAPSFGVLGAALFSARVVGPLTFEAALQAEALLFRPQFQLDDLGKVHTAGPVVGRLFLGLGLEFL